MRRSLLLPIFLGAALGAACDERARPLIDDHFVDVPPRDSEHFPPGFEGSTNAAARLATRPAVSSGVELAPIAGGTLLITADMELAIAADPDRDQIAVVDLEAGVVTRRIALQPGDQPGRSIEMSATRVATVLRGAGALALFDPRVGTVERVAVCPEPRGVAYDAERDATYVTCMTGELVTLGSGATRELARRRVDVDLRDVWIEGEELRITRFRSAEVIATDRAGVELSRHRPPSTEPFRAAPASDGGVGSFGGRFSATVAWRAIPLASGGAILAHQRALDDPVTPVPGGYGGNRLCDSGIVQGVLTVVDAFGIVRGGPTLVGGVLPVDVAVSRDGTQVAVALPGNAEAAVVQVFAFDAVSAMSSSDCAQPLDLVASPDANEAVAVGFTRNNDLIVQYRDPAVLRLGGRGIVLSESRATDTGHLVFHMNAGAGIACASCHPEGGEDGHVWSFDGLGARRTQSLAGGLSGTEPFHWSGDMADLATLTHEVFTSRMGGPPLDTAQLGALSHWLDRLPLPAAPTARDPQAAERGRALFEREDVACASCHAGERLQLQGSFDVGTGGLFQVPSLRGVAYRAPLLHSGRAPDLRGRFDPSGGGDRHGYTSMLSPSELDDLVQYLETL